MRYNTKIKSGGNHADYDNGSFAFSGFSAAAQSVDDAIQAAVTKLALKGCRRNGNRLQGRCYLF